MPQKIKPTVSLLITSKATMKVAKKKSNRRRKIGFDLERMRNKRVMADYQRDATNNLTVLSSEANDVLARSERVISKLEAKGI
ncbi:MAG: hypothetical protein U9N48_03610 [Euryarchaeota archaeon]|nr:hypothetical protein [Euryarchaeota archaeon]